MRVGIDGCVFSSELAGIGNYGFHLLRAMAKYAKEHQFVILTQQPLPIEFNESNISIYIDTDAMVQNAYYWKFYGMAGACRRTGIDVFWAVSGVAPPIMPCPVVLTVYDFVHLEAPETMSARACWFRRLIQPWWIKRAMQVFTISYAVSVEMHNLYGRKASAIVYPATDITFFPQEKKSVEVLLQRYGLETRYNMTVGTLEPRKNVHLLVNEYLAFQRAHPDVQLPPLLVIGGDGWKDTEIVRVLDSAESSGLARRLGYVPADDLPGLYSGAEFFFLPSRYEGFGMPILEARKCGCPVVCSDIPAMREAGGVGTLYHPPTAEGIRWALEEIYLHGRLPERDAASDVEWSWGGGAKQIMGLFQHAVAVKDE